MYLKWKIYSHLLFFMLTKNKEEKFYYLRQPSKERDAFLAIVGLKLEKRLDFNKQIQVNTYIFSVHSGALIITTYKS